MSSIFSTIFRHLSWSHAIRAEIEEHAMFWVGTLPGAAGFFIRYVVYRPLFKQISSAPIIFPHVRFIDMWNISLGKKVLINSFSYLYGRGGLDIGDHVMISPNCSIVSGNHDLSTRQFMIDAPSILEKITIEKDSWIGANTVILPGITIGQGTVVGAGSVVTKNTEPYSIVVGSPAHRIKNRNPKLVFSTF